MPLAFTVYDWGILLAYVALLAFAGYQATRRTKTADDYFLAGHHAPVWLVAVSVLSTMQSAATFLGAPDNSYRGDYSYLTSNFAAIIAAFIVARFLIPRFYAIGATTVYELLEARFDATARRAAAGMYLVGRILASGARLYLAAIAVSMIIFLDVAPQHIVIASAVLVVFGVVFTLFGGLNAVIWSDLVQVVLYLGGAVLVLIFLLVKIPAPAPEIWDALQSAPDGMDKLRLFDWSFDFTKPFTVWAILTGLVLLNIGNVGLDQDTTQRFLACENAQSGKRALYASMWAAIPVVALFMAIGSLLHIFYNRPDLMGVSVGATNAFAGEKITVFMSFILSEIPPGLRGLVTVGVIAAAAINSGLISMSAVVVNDFYRPWLERRGAPSNEQHYVNAGRAAMILLACALFAMSILCFYWQHYSDTPLLEFVLGVMVFAYSGLLGVYGTVVFTKRGATWSVIAALLAGFVTILLQQHYVVDSLGLPTAWKALAFPWQLCIGTAVAFAVCCVGRDIKDKSDTAPVIA